MKDNILFRVGDWEQGRGELWNKIEQEEENGDGGYWFSQENGGVWGLAMLYDRENDLVKIKQYAHCSCIGTDYETGGREEDLKFLGTPQHLKKIILDNADYAMPQRKCDPQDRYYKHGQVLYHVFAVWLSEGKPSWEGKGRAYHVDHGALEPRHFKDEDQYFGQYDLPYDE